MSDPQNPQPPFSPPPPQGNPQQGYPPQQAYPPQHGYGQPQGYPPPQGFPPPPPAKKGMPVWGWILIGFFVLVFIGMAAMSVLAYLFVKKAEDVAKNPVTAVVRMAVAANPDLELLDVNENTGKVTVRDRKTGKTVTIDGDAIKDGKLTIDSDEGSAVFGTGANVTVPAWVYMPADAKLVGGMTGGGASGEGGTVLFTTSESLASLKSFFEDKYKAAGFEENLSTVTANDEERALQLIFKHDDRHRTVSIGVAMTGDGASGTLTYATEK